MKALSVCNGNKKLPQTCNFCNCLNDSLIRDRFVLGIRDEAVRKKLLQEKKLTLSRAIDIGRSGETANLRLKELKKPLEDEVNALRQNKKMWNKEQRDPGTQNEGLANIAVETTNEAFVLRMVRNVTIVVDKAISQKSVYKRSSRQ